MKKIFYTIPLLLLALSLTFIHNGCKSDEVVTPTEENVDKESVSTNNFTVLSKVITDAVSDAIYRTNGTAPPGIAGCPSVNDSANRFLAISFGMPPGCTSPIDGVRRSGSYEVSYTLFPSADSAYCVIKFIDFRVYKTSSNADTNNVKFQTGTIYFSLKKTGTAAYNMRAKGELILVNQSGQTKEFYLDSLNAAVNSGAPNNVADDSYLVYGGQRIKDNQLNVTYTVSIPSSTALNFVSTCKYPLSGIMNITSSGTKCDFSPNNNACDALVKISKGSTSKEIDLSGINF